MTPTEQRARNRAQHNNPRKLPEKWIKAYLERRPEQLAEDVLQVYDEQFKLQRKMNLKLRNEVVIAVLAGLLARAPEILHWVVAITR